jgi:[glutamine synthetase] adenylyltransferase / [glutamine synthetase]-adenylyl-L-tyrosine phosphorylase
VTDGGRTGLSLARLGLTDDGAADILTKLGWWGHGRPGPDAEGFLWALSRAPDPNLALRTLDRLARAADTEWPELDAALRGEPALRGCWFLLRRSHRVGQSVLSSGCSPQWVWTRLMGRLHPGPASKHSVLCVTLTAI